MLYNVESRRPISKEVLAALGMSDDDYRKGKENQLISIHLQGANFYEDWPKNGTGNLVDTITIGETEFRWSGHDIISKNHFLDFSYVLLSHDDDEFQRHIIKKPPTRREASELRKKLRAFVRGFGVQALEDSKRTGDLLLAIRALDLGSEDGILKDESSLSLVALATQDDLQRRIQVAEIMDEVIERDRSAHPSSEAPPIES